MHTKIYSVSIYAPDVKVWTALWEDSNYRDWTSVYCEGSYMKADWKKGGKVHFLAPDGQGMYSVIKELIPNEKVHFTHIGNLLNFEEQPMDDSTFTWTGARENYDLVSSGNTTLLSMTIDLTDDHLDYFEKTIPAALQRVKEIAEKL